jgi:hypothetical protein
MLRRTKVTTLGSPFRNTVRDRFYSVQQDPIDYILRLEVLHLSQREGCYFVDNLRRQHDNQRLSCVELTHPEGSLH